MKTIEELANECGIEYEGHYDSATDGDYIEYSATESQLEAFCKAYMRERLFLCKATPVSGEPFGYFKTEPFGWVDCAESDEGAVALYEAPQPASVSGEAVGYVDEFGNFENNLKPWMKDEPNVIWKAVYTTPQPAIPEGYELVNSTGYNILKERAEIDSKRQLAYWQVLVKHNLTQEVRTDLHQQLADTVPRVQYNRAIEALKKYVPKNAFKDNNMWFFEGTVDGISYDIECSEHEQALEALAEAMMNAPQPAPDTVPEGYALVPLKVTPAIEAIYGNEKCIYQTSQDMHDAMIAEAMKVE